jgi:hypothetical protein
MEKGEEETLDESSIRQESVLLKVEKACHPTPHRERKKACKIQAGKLQIEAIEE